MKYDYVHIINLIIYIYMIKLRKFLYTGYVHTAQYTRTFLNILLIRIVLYIYIIHHNIKNSLIYKLYIYIYVCFSLTHMLYKILLLP